MFKIAVFVGSIRRESSNHAFARALEKLAGNRLKFQFAAVGTLPLYSQDLEQNLPEPVVEMKQLVEASDAILFVTPEYNRSIPGVLKNAIDWGSRPWGHNSWAGKPASVVGTSPGTIGSAVAQSHLRSILPFFDMPMMGQPEIYFQTRPDLIDEDFNITDEPTRLFLESYVNKLVTFVGRHAQPAPVREAAE